LTKASQVNWFAASAAVIEAENVRDKIEVAPRRSDALAQTTER